jgi:hypothetical protein
MAYGAGGLIAAALAYALLGGEPVQPERATDAVSVTQAFAEQRSGLMLETSGVVERVLSDDRQGSPHQRFIVRLASGHTVLIAHNIDLAPRVADLVAGDEVRFRGQYEYNERGGVIHWTHDDPRGEHPGGWIEHHGRFYR